MPLPDAIRSMRSALFIVSPGRSLCPQRARGGSTPWVRNPAALF